MTTKSFVSTEQHICPVCGIPHDTGAILMDKQLKNTFKSRTVTGYSLCPDHKKLFEAGYVAAVEIDEAKSTLEDGKLKPAGAYRTGRYLHIRRGVWDQIFNMKLPEGIPFVYIQIEAYDKVAALVS